jgi:hypothetical protein
MREVHPCRAVCFLIVAVFVEVAESAVVVVLHAA